MKLKSILKKAEKASKVLTPLSHTRVKLSSIKIALDNPSTGHFRLKGILGKEAFVEIFEFIFQEI